MEEHPPTTCISSLAAAALQTSVSRQMKRCSECGSEATSRMGHHVRLIPPEPFARAGAGRAGHRQIRRIAPHVGV